MFLDGENNIAIRAAQPSAGERVYQGRDAYSAAESILPMRVETAGRE